MEEFRDRLGLDYVCWDETQEIDNNFKVFYTCIKPIKQFLCLKYFKNIKEISNNVSNYYGMVFCNFKAHNQPNNDIKISS